MNISAWIRGLKIISPNSIYRMVLDSEPISIFDVNSHQSWMKAHNPGASNLDPFTYRESDLPENKEPNLVFYCSNPMCQKVSKAARRAKKYGFINVKVMSVGINGWISRKLPTEIDE